jgi:hypothetical protein
MEKRYFLTSIKPFALDAGCATLPARMADILPFDLGLTEKWKWILSGVWDVDCVRRFARCQVASVLMMPIDMMHSWFFSVSILR